MAYKPPMSLADIFKGMAPKNVANPFLNTFAMPIAPAVPTTQVTRTLPNGQGTYDSPVISQPSAPVAPPVVPPVTKPIVPPTAPVAPVVTQPTAPVIPPDRIDPATGQMYTPEAYANHIAQRASGGSIPNYVKNDITQRTQETQTVPQLTSSATDLSNQRNDIATGTTDPYNVASKSGIPYSPAEMTAIEKAYAGIYDPALKDVYAKLDAKEKLAQAAQNHKDALELAQIKANQDDPSSTKNQDKYEQQYRQILLKPLSNRSGGLGLEDAKVNQAIHLKAIFDQYKDANGNYNIPTVLYNELALGLARLISPTGVVGSEVQNSITQKSLKGDIAGMLTYITGTPMSGTTQDVLKVMQDSIDRQGQVAETNRDQYMSYLQGLVPTDLSPERQAALEKNLLNSYVNNKGASGGVLKGLDENGNPGEVKISDLTPAQIEEAKAAGWQ